MKKKTKKGATKPVQKNRKFFKLEDVEATLESVKQGDIFRYEGEKTYWIAESDAVPCDPPGNFTVNASRVAVVRTLEMVKQ